MQTDHAVPAALVAGRQVFNEPRGFNALFVGHVRIGAQHLRQFRAGLGVVVFIGAGQGDDQSATHIVGNAVHVVDLGGQQQLADIGKHRVGHESLAVHIRLAVHAGGHAAGIKTFGDGD